jgi:hypothetical protein
MHRRWIALVCSWTRSRSRLVQLPAFLTQLQDGDIRLTGHRIGLYHLVRHYNEGESAEMLAAPYPTTFCCLRGY